MILENANIVPSGNTRFPVICITDMGLIIHPSTIDLIDMEGQKESLESFLSYYDKSVDYQIAKFKKADWFIARYGDAMFKERLEELKASRNKSLLLYHDEIPYTYTGLLPQLRQRFPKESIRYDFSYPDESTLPWNTIPPELRPYQNSAVDNLLRDLSENPGPRAVSMGTGLGKSFIIMHLLRRLGLKAVVMAPSVSIATQLLDDFRKYLGPKNVGQYFDGKKEYKKLITVGIHASLVKIDWNNPAWQELGEAQVFIADESHMTPADTLHKVCVGLCANAPYRFFFSGTQTRTDGSELLLKGIIGDIVFTMSVKEGVDQGWLAKPIFRMVREISDSGYISDDPNNMSREHLLLNPYVCQKAGQIANAMHRQCGHQVLILIDEIEQFAKLLPHLLVKTQFAHGPLNKSNIKSVPTEYQKSNVKELVEGFNAGQIPCLVGTSCISMGTDIRPVRTLIYLAGGKSEIAVSQAIGRGTRKVDGKEWFNVIDFDIHNQPVTHRHAVARAAIYDSIYGPVQWV